MTTTHIGGSTIHIKRGNPPPEVVYRDRPVPVPYEVPVHDLRPLAYSFVAGGAFSFLLSLVL